VAIYTPLELVNSAPARTIPEAILKGAVNTICTGAPYLAGFGLATGNLPAIAFGLSASITCGIPSIFQEDFPPPSFISASGGQCATNYWVRVRGQFSKPGGFVRIVESPRKLLRGPLGALYRYDAPLVGGGTEKYVRGGFNAGAQYEDWLQVSSGEGASASFWDWWEYLEITRADGLPDDCGSSPPSWNGTPEGALLPPGWPDSPTIPGKKVEVPYLPESDTSGKNPWKLPIAILPIILPVRILANGEIRIPIDAPISIKGELDLLPDANISGELNIQLDSEGNLRTEPDLLPEEKEEEKKEPAPALTLLQLPYGECGEEGGNVEFASVLALPQSIAPGLPQLLAQSAQLAVRACDIKKKEPVPPIRITSQSSPDHRGHVWSVELTDPDTRVVRLKIIQVRDKNIRETSHFPGSGQRLYGALGWCLEGGMGGGEPMEVWDLATDLYVPPASLPRFVKILARGALSWELWDTGDRF
jgi:hypothetical protein